MRSDREKSRLLLEEQNLYKAFLILALPVCGVNLLKSFNELVDTFFIGQMADSVAAQAGMSIAWPLINLLQAFQIGLAVAGVAIVSQFLGAGNEEEARKYGGQLLIAAGAMGLAVGAVLYAAAPLVMGWMGAEGDVLAYSSAYIRVRSFEMVFSFVFAAFQAIRQAQGDTVTPVLLSGGAIAVNIVLTGCFVRVLGLGVFGAGLATAIGQALAAPAGVALLLRDRGRMRLSRQCFRMDAGRMRKLFFLSGPSAAAQAFSSFGFLFLQAFILDYGNVVIAAFNIGNKLANTLMLPMAALGSVLAAYVGQNIGSGNKARAVQSYRVSRNLGIWISIGGSAALFFVREQIVGLLTNDPATAQAAVEYVIWVLLTQPLLGLFQNYISVFNGSGNTKYSFAITAARLWCIRLPLILIFKNFTDVGRAGIWYAMVISNFLIVLVGMALFRKVDFEPKIR